MSRYKRRKAARRRRAQLARAELAPQLAQRRLAQRRRTVRMKSWRKKKPQWLCRIICQVKSICWAIAFIRHYEFRLKQNGLLPLEEHLSIQDFINNTPKMYLTEDGTFIPHLSFAASVLESKGVLLERDCELTESLVDAPLSDPLLKRYFPTEVLVHSLNRCGLVQVKLDDQMDKLCKLLKGGCVAARIAIYDSYIQLKGKEIYFPTKHELDCGKPWGHVVLLTKYDFDDDDRIFFQFQESYGVDICDRGYAYVYGDMITHFVDIEL